MRPLMGDEDTRRPSGRGELRLDQGAHGAHVGAAGRAGLYQRHDFAHVLDRGGAAFGDRRGDERFELGGRELFGQIALQQDDLGDFLGGEVGTTARFELGDGFAPLLDHLLEDGGDLRVVEHDPLIHLALLNGCLKHADLPEAILFSGAHRGLHVLSDALLERHRLARGVGQRGRTMRGLVRLTARLTAAAFLRLRSCVGFS